MRANDYEPWMPCAWFRFTNTPGECHTRVANSLTLYGPNEKPRTLHFCDAHWPAVQVRAQARGAKRIERL